MNDYQITIYTHVIFKWNELRCNYNYEGTGLGRVLLPVPYYVRIYE